jgi:hypothetical protein
MSYLNWTTSSTVEAPIIVHIETDRAKDCNFEEDLPSRKQASMFVQPRSPIGFRIRERQNVCYGSKRVSAAKLIGKKNSNIENPGRDWHILSR